MDKMVSYAQSHSAISASVAVTAAVVIAWAWSRRASGKNLPPGPTQDPFIGGLRSLPSSYPWFTFAEWGKVWGNVVYTSIFGTPILVLNSIDVARELLDKRGSTFSDRPRSLVQGELLDWDALTVMRYGDRFRKHRKMISQVLNSQAIGAYRELQANNTHVLLKSLLRDPASFERHIFWQAYTTVIRLTYGLNVTSEDDSLVPLLAEMLVRIVAEGAPGLNMIDLFPILKYMPSWLPGCGFQSRLSKTKTYVDEAINVPFVRAEKQRRMGTSRASLVSDLLEEYESLEVDDPEHINDIKSIASVMYAAGVETTATTTATFIQMMAKYPNAVARAQLEIDAVTKQERLPTFEDRKDLPSIDCIMKEVFRINPAAPLAIPHRATEEDTYGGFRIPEGSIIFPNIWQMMHDPKYYPDPHVFNPDRFRTKVESLGGNSTSVLNGLDKDDPSAIVFGFGRRICPGRYFVDATLWLSMASILSVFDIGPPLDASGVPKVIGEVKFTSGVTSRPEPFDCTIKPRNAECAALIIDAEVTSDL